MALHPGLVLSGRYRLTRRIAVGGMGEVWAGVDRTLGRNIAVKILRPELTTDPEFVGRFRVEAQITASLNNPGIAAVYDYGETASHPDGPQDTAFLVMELVGGEPLSAVLARTRRIAVDRVLDVLEQSGRALQEAHARGLVHRDIKPGNILITPTGQVKITDFGIAKVAHQVPVTKGGLVMGTAQYLSPEQAAGDDARPASDVYALGIVGYECLAGFRPFVGDNPVIVAMAQIRTEPPPLPADIPAAVVDLIRHALAKDPSRRYPNGATFAHAVAAVRSGSGASNATLRRPDATALPATQAFAAPTRAFAAATQALPASTTARPYAPPQPSPRRGPAPWRWPPLGRGSTPAEPAHRPVGADRAADPGVAGAVGTAMYFQTSALSGAGGLVTTMRPSAVVLTESMIVSRSEGWS